MENQPPKVHENRVPSTLTLNDLSHSISSLGKFLIERYIMHYQRSITHARFWGIAFLPVDTNMKMLP